MKIAIVHDFLCQYGGAEKVVEALHETFPDAPIYTSIFVPERLPESFQKMDIRPSFMRYLPGLADHFKKYAALYPLAMASLDLSGYNVVLSSSSAFAKGVRVPDGARHLCYCYTPMRYVWRSASYFEKESVPRWARPVLPLLLAALKRWDLRTAPGVGRYIAISRCIQDRIAEAYGRTSDLLYPPVETDRFAPTEKVEDFLLVVSRLAPYKRIDLVIGAANALGRPLVIIGGGPDEARLKSLAGPTVRFLGRLPDAELPSWFARARAFVFPGEEDFGIAPVEAMAAGRPVVAYGAGGALETVKDGETGVFFAEPTVASLIGALKRSDTIAWDPVAIQAWARRFDTSVFQSGIRKIVEETSSRLETGGCFASPATT